MSGLYGYQQLTNLAETPSNLGNPLSPKRSSPWVTNMANHLTWPNTGECDKHGPIFCFSGAHPTNGGRHWKLVRLLRWANRRLSGSTRKKWGPPESGGCQRSGEQRSGQHIQSANGPRQPQDQTTEKTAARHAKDEAPNDPDAKKERTGRKKAGRPDRCKATAPKAVSESEGQQSRYQTDKTQTWKARSEQTGRQESKNLGKMKRQNSTSQSRVGHGHDSRSGNPCNRPSLLPQKIKVDQCLSTKSWASFGWQCPLPQPTHLGCALSRRANCSAEASQFPASCGWMPRDFGEHPKDEFFEAGAKRVRFTEARHGRFF